MLATLVGLLDVYVWTIASACALLWPTFRVILRCCKKITPYIKRCTFIQDATNGAALPHFCLMILSPFGSNIVVEGHVIFLAGLYGSHAIIKDILTE